MEALEFIDPSVTGSEKPANTGILEESRSFVRRS